MCHVFPVFCFSYDAESKALVDKQLSMEFQCIIHLI